MRRGTGLAAYIGTGSLYIILISLVFSGLWGIWAINTATRRSLSSANELSAKAVSGRLEEFLDRTLQALDQIESDVLRPDLHPPERLRESLEEVLSIYPFLDQVEVIGPDARIRSLAPWDGGFVGLSRAGDAVFESIRASSKTEWSASYVSLKNNAPAVTFGKKVGGSVILCDLNLSSIERFSAPAPDEGQGGTRISITDGNGVLLSDRDGRRVRQREQLEGFATIRKATGTGASVEIGSPGDRYLVSVSRLADPAWFVIIRYPMSRLTGLLRSYYAGFFPILLAAAALGFIASRIRVRRIAAALRQLSLKASRISLGQYDELVDFGGGFIEFDEVGGSFNGMITGIKAREALLINREREFREILEDIRLFALGIDNQGRISFANSCLLDALGLSMQELDGRDIRVILPSCEPFLYMARDGGRGHSFECHVHPREGEPRLVEWTITANRDSSGAISGATGIGWDITERRMQSRKLESSLAEKEILLREVHHRVKNNLQLISSLLALQERESDDAATVRHLLEAQDRIRSISLIHETLYGSDDFGGIDFGEYASLLAKEILGDRTGAGLEVRTDLGKVGLSLSEAIPLGLILNEALTNVRKYAFPDGYKGERLVELSLGRDEAGLVRLGVRDNGVGLPPGYDPDRSETLGHTIMRQLCLQIGGTLTIASDTGTAIEVRFSPGGLSQ